MPDPKEIWLQPWCDGCQRHSGNQGRLWCEDDVWGKCDECGAPSVKYRLAARRSNSRKSDD